MPKPRQVTRKPATPQETDARIEAIADMMRNLQWQRGKSAKVLAQQWGLAKDTVEGLSAQAWRIVRKEATNTEEVRADVAQTCLTNLQRASDAGEFRAVASLADVVTKIVGARAPDRIDVTSRSDEELRARWVELTGVEYVDREDLS